MTEFRFLWPIAFVFLLPLIWKLWSAYRGNSIARLSVLQYSDTRLLGGISPTMRVRLRRIPSLLQWLGYTSLVIALARPQMGTEVINQRFDGIDLVITLDISDSMASPFDGQTRLEAAKAVTASFAQDRSNDRLGLVAFAEQAFFLSPPTLDRTLYLRILGDVTSASALNISNRTAIGMGITSAAALLADSTAPSRVILVITDGANNAGTIDPFTASQAASALGIRIFTLGMGASGQDSDLDEGTLRQIATQTGGRYFNALTTADMEAIYTTIDQLVTDPRVLELRVQWQDQAFLWILGALALLMVGKFLERTVFQTIP